MRALIVTAKTETLNKIRSQGFLVMLLSMAILAMVFFPQNNASYQTILLGEYRGIYNSAWIGHSFAMLNVSFLPFILFYFLRGAIQSDARSLRGEILVATQFNKFEYLMGKVLSNFVIALIVVIWMTLIAVFMQVWIGEDRQINLLNLLLPQLIHVVPMLFFISVITIVFDTLPILRTSVGNVAYFFLASAGLVLLSYDTTGINYIVSQMKALILDKHQIVIENINIGITAVADNTSIKTFVWEGISYANFPFSSIAYMFLFSVLLFIIALLSFNKTSLLAMREKKPSQSALLNGVRKFLGFTQYIDQFICTMFGGNKLLNLARLEFLLLIGNRSSYLWLGLFGLWIAQWFVSFTILLTAILPAVLLISALIVSALGQREKSSGTQDFLINAPLLLKVQYPAMLISGIAFLVAVSLPSLIRLTVVQEFYSCTLLLAGYFWIISSAIMLGTLSRGSKTFEILFVLVWYMGPISRFVHMDFIGVSPQLSEQINAAFIFFCIAIIFNIFAIFIRKRTLI